MAKKQAIKINPNDCVEGLSSFTTSVSVLSTIVPLVIEYLKEEGFQSVEYKKKLTERFENAFKDLRSHYE